MKKKILMVLLVCVSVAAFIMAVVALSSGGRQGIPGETGQQGQTGQPGNTGNPGQDGPTLDEILDAISQALLVRDQIADLPTTITLADRKDVRAARKAFDALTSGQQAWVTNIDVLVAAEARIAELKQARKDALVVVGMIDALPTTITLNHATQIRDARVAFDALSTDAKTLVTNLDVLVAAEAELARLENSLLSLVWEYLPAARNWVDQALAGLDPSIVAQNIVNLVPNAIIDGALTGFLSQTNLRETIMGMISVNTGDFGLPINVTIQLVPGGSSSFLGGMIIVNHDELFDAFLTLASNNTQMLVDLLGQSTDPMVQLLVNALADPTFNIALLLHQDTTPAQQAAMLGPIITDMATTMLVGAIEVAIDNLDVDAVFDTLISILASIPLPNQIYNKS